MSFLSAITKRYISSYQGLSHESWMLSVVMLINRSGAMVLPFMTMFITSELGYGIKEAGYAMSCFGMGSLIGSWVGGWLVDRIGSYRVQYLSLFLSVPVYLIIPHYRSIIALSIALLILSIITECLRPANSVAIQLFAKPTNLTRAFSLNRMAINLGFSIGPGIGGLLVVISYDLLFYVNALGNLAAGVVFVLFFRNQKKRNELPDTKFHVETKKSNEKSPYRDRPFIWFTVFCTLYCIGFLQLLNTIPVFYQQGLGMDATDIGLVLAYSGFVIVILEMPMVDFLERRMALRHVLVFGALLTAMSFFAYTLHTSLLIAYVSMTLLSIGEIWMFPFMSAITAMRSGENNRGAYMGMNGLSFAIGFIVAPILGTYIQSMVGFEGLWYFITAILLITAIGFQYNAKRLM